MKVSGLSVGRVSAGAGILLALAMLALAFMPRLLGGSGGGAVALSTCVAPQRVGDDPARLLRDPVRFDCSRRQTDWGPGSYWVRLNIPPASSIAAARADDPPRQLRFVPQWQRALAISTRDADGHVLTRWFDDADLSRLIGIGASIGIPLEGHERPVTQVLVRVDNALNGAGLIGDPQLLDPTRMHRDEMIATAIFAGFAGLGLGLFCYNIVLWLTIRERFQLTYCLSLLAMLAYVWSNSGAMAVQFPNIPHTTRLQTSYLLLSFVGALALQFITDFIEPGKIPRSLHRAAQWTGHACMIAGLAMVLTPVDWLWYADRFYVICFMPLPPLVVAITWCAWRRGSTSVRVLMVAWAVPLAMAILRIAHALHLVEYGLMVQYSLVLGMSIEALLSSLAMSFRIKLVTDERDRALADERAARHLASVDSLTGLLNRRALLEQVVDWKNPDPLRLLLIDIDRFKNINDRHGHLVGDDVLRDVAEVLAIRAELRGSVARLGGEEFALIGAAHEVHEGLALAILADMRSRPMAGSVHLTVSVGMADGMVRCEDEWRELYRRADAALYRAKAEGRNRVVHADPAGAAPASAVPSRRAMRA